MPNIYTDKNLFREIVADYDNETFDYDYGDVIGPKSNDLAWDQEYMFY